MKQHRTQKPVAGGKTPMEQKQVDKIIGWYKGRSEKVLANLTRLLEAGTLSGTGKLVILPVDQGFEHGPGRSFAPNPAGYDPRYHFDLALKAGCNAHAAPLGALEMSAWEYAKKLPLILKANGSELLSAGDCPAVTASVKDAVRLGCCAIGYTIYPGSPRYKEMYEQLREMIEEARAAGLVVVVWSYPRGGKLDTKEKQEAADVIAYAAQLACLLGADIVKVKPPRGTLFFPGKKEGTYLYNELGIKTETLTDRIKHVVQSAFNGQRIVIFSGGEAKEDEAVFEEVRAIRDGGGFGSIIGRNAFQRPENEAVPFLQHVMRIYAGEDQ